VVGGEPREHCVEAGTIGAVERCEELALDARGDRAELGELLASGGRQADDMAAPVVRIGAALDQLVLLERVEEADELAPVELQRIGDRRLRIARALVEQRQDGVVVRAEAGLLELLERAHLDRDAQAGEQEGGAGEQLRRHAVGEGRCHGHG
jgi:hypothetical protein